MEQPPAYDEIFNESPPTDQSDERLHPTRLTHSDIGLMFSVGIGVAAGIFSYYYFSETKPTRDVPHSRPPPDECDD